MINMKLFANVLILMVSPPTQHSNLSTQNTDMLTLP
jgi:hypothetical protein